MLRSPFPKVIIPELPLTEYILGSIATRGDRIAIVDAPTGRELSFKEVGDLVVKCASALYRRGLRKGDVVATCTTNSPEYIITILSIAACGGIVTTCNPFYTENEMRHQFQHSEPKMAFVVPLSCSKVVEVAKTVPSLQTIIAIDKVDGMLSFDELISGEDGSHFPRNVSIDPLEDIVFLPYSSGTTGLPKGVMLTHYNMVSCITLCKVKPGFSTDCVYSVLPIFHIYGLLVAYVSLDQGIKHVLDVRFDLESMFSSMEKYKVTRFSSVPPMLLAMMKSPLLDKYNLSHLSSIGSGAAPLPPEIAKSLEEKIGCHVAQGWGLTEVVPITTPDLVSTPLQSVGSVCANTKVKVIDVETGKLLGPYANGELCVKGPQVMKGYFKNPTATMNTIDADGWLHTGDIGHYDENEMVYIVDRLKELIKYKGFQVAPAELEAVLIGHPKIADTAVIGVPDTEAGELAKAFVVKKDTSLTKEEIHQYVGGKLSKYKHLHGGIEFRNMIEKTPSGKILRRALREQNTKAAM